MSQWLSSIKLLQKQMQIQGQEMTRKLFWLITWSNDNEEQLRIQSCGKKPHRSLIYISNAYDMPDLSHMQITDKKNPTIYADALILWK